MIKRKNVLKILTSIFQAVPTLGIIGGTGSGKSSLVQLIPRLYDVTEEALRLAVLM